MKIMAVDLGKARTGLAICDEEEILYWPAGVITEYNREKLTERIAQEAAEYGAAQLVVGLPRNMDGTEGESARGAREFGAALAERTGLPVDFCDERGTTITAHEYLNATDTRGKRRKAVVDAVAATVILENYLAARRSRRAREGEA